MWGTRPSFSETFLNEKFVECRVGAMQFHRAFWVLTFGLSCLGHAAAVVITSKTVDGKRVECMHTGLGSDISDCGVRSYSYTYVFVGSITAITPATENEKKIRIVPEEVFSGKPGRSVTVVTSQGLCLPRLTVGDRWLFYLRKVDGKQIILDYYGNDSRPVADAQDEIAILRRLVTIGDFGILRGLVWRDQKVVPNAHVIAVRRSDGMRFVVTANAQGRYEFQPLPPGSYSVSAIGLGRPAEIDLNPGICWDLTLSTVRR
jgi:hypothetical protein